MVTKEELMLIKDVIRNSGRNSIGFSILERKIPSIKGKFIQDNELRVYNFMLYGRKCRAVMLKGKN